MKKQTRLSMKLLWKLNADFLTKCADGRYTPENTIKDFLDFVEEQMKSLSGKN